MSIMHFGNRTGTDRHVNGPHRFTITVNGLLALGAFIVAVGLGYGAHVLAWG